MLTTLYLPRGSDAVGHLPRQLRATRNSHSSALVLRANRINTRARGHYQRLYWSRESNSSSALMSSCWSCAFVSFETYETISRRRSSGSHLPKGCVPKADVTTRLAGPRGAGRASSSKRVAAITHFEMSGGETCVIYSIWPSKRIKTRQSLRNARKPPLILHHSGRAVAFPGRTAAPPGRAVVSPGRAATCACIPSRSHFSFLGRTNKPMCRTPAALREEKTE